LKHYETLLLVQTDSTEAKIKVLENAISEALKKADGKPVSFEKWGKYKLAYPVNKQNYGLYILSRYELPDDNASKFFKDFDINVKVRLSEFLMRHVNVALTSAQANVEYKKPSPIDENESIATDRRIMSMSNQSLDLDNDLLDDGQSDGEVLDISKLTLDPEDETLSD
jgi:small subunit ribosomal protein S6